MGWVSAAASFYALGVTFTFSDTSGEVYGAPVNVGAIVNGLQGPGDTTITLAFDHPSTFLSFDMNLALGVDSRQGALCWMGEVPCHLQQRTR